MSNREEKNRSFKVFCPKCQSYNIIPFSKTDTIRDNRKIICKFCKNEIEVIINNSK